MIRALADRSSEELGKWKTCRPKGAGTRQPRQTKSGLLWVCQAGHLVSADQTLSSRSVWEAISGRAEIKCWFCDVTQCKQLRLGPVVLFLTLLAVETEGDDGLDEKLVDSLSLPRKNSGKEIPFTFAEIQCWFWPLFWCWGLFFRESGTNHGGLRALSVPLRS